MGKKQIMGIDMDAIKIEVEMPEWKHLMLPTACICCDCSFFFEYPECCSCREVGTCLCCTGAAECSIDTKHFDQSFCMGDGPMDSSRGFTAYVPNCESSGSAPAAEEKPAETAE